MLEKILANYLEIYMISTLFSYFNVDLDFYIIDNSVNISLYLFNEDNYLTICNCSSI